jgi:hypothetical protein
MGSNPSQEPGKSDTESESVDIDCDLVDRMLRLHPDWISADELFTAILTDIVREDLPAVDRGDEPPP